MFTHADRFSFAYFSFWMILIITHSGHWKNYSSNLIKILDTPMNIFQTAKIFFCMFGVRNDEKQSLIIWSQTTPDFEILRILNNGCHWNALSCKVLPIHVWQSIIKVKFSDFWISAIIDLGHSKKTVSLNTISTSGKFH